jgi:hypothetical protein
MDAAKLSQWVEHTNHLLWAHARIHRGDQGLKANNAAFVHRVAVRENTTPLSEIGRLFHLHEAPDPSLLRDRGRRMEALFPASGWLACLLSPIVGVYGAARLLRQGLADRSLRHELTQLRSEIERSESIVADLVERKEEGSQCVEYIFPCGDYSYYANGAGRVALWDIQWIENKIAALTDVERLCYSSACALFSWNLVGAFALYSALRPLPSGRWLLYAALSATAATGLAAFHWLSTIKIACCGGGIEEDIERSSYQIEPRQREFLNSIDPELDTEAGHSTFGLAIVYQRAVAMKALKEGQALTFSKPIAFVWQDGQEHAQLTNKSELSWKGKELNKDYWGLFRETKAREL